MTSRVCSCARRDGRITEAPANWRFEIFEPTTELLLFAVIRLSVLIAYRFTATVRCQPVSWTCLSSLCFLPEAAASFLS